MTRDEIKQTFNMRDILAKWKNCILTNGERPLKHQKDRM